MKIKFCGAAQTVTGSCYLLTLDDGYTILMDAGFYQGSKKEFNDFNRLWLFNPREIDCMVLSHAHIDHCGRIPKLVKDGFKGNIFCTSATRDLAAMMLLDSAKIQERDAYYSNKRRKKRGEPQDVVPIYITRDAKNCMRNFIGIGYDKLHRINDKVSVNFRDNGHILGSASIALRIKIGSEEICLGFTGDIGKPQRPILKDPSAMDDLDFLLCESTYGGRAHDKTPPFKELGGSIPVDKMSDNSRNLLNIVNETCVINKGKLLIPAFSVGRTQEIVYILDLLETEGKLPKIPVYVDSPLATNATDIFKLHPECFDDEILNYMLTDPNPFGFADLKYIRKVEDSKKLNTSKGPAIIISASGMITAGRIRHHVFHNIENENTTILIVGYCAPGTLGAILRNGAKRVRIFRKDLRVKARIEVLDSFSAHADQMEMIEFLSNLNRGRLKSLFLVHGEKDQQEIFKSVLENHGFSNIKFPKLNEEFTL
ncbi:MAG: MBL fold metallo-hydrolase [Candidatus Omnitrophica bacterium]|nr:MBL fold metallo-hydrolase [Candidatus Omnitrophota bacterium]